MKYIIFIAFLFISCTKQAATDSGKDNLIQFNNAVQGKWNIITDSFYSGVGVSNHLTAYTGKSGDYFDFRTDSNVYIKEDTSFDTLSYRLISDSAIIIQSFGPVLNGPDTSRLNLTANSAIIFSPVLLTPGGIYKRNVYLNR